MGTVTAPAAWMPKSDQIHCRLFSPIRTTRSPALTPASVSPDATANASRRIAFQLSVCQAPSTRWWISARSPYFAAWRRNTPRVVRSLTECGSISWVAVSGLTPVLVELVALFDRLDRQRESAGWHGNRDPVALLAADERAPDGRVDRDASCRRVALDRADQMVSLALALVVDDLDRGAGTDHARVRVPDDLRAADHLLQLV